jgi:hypothetical protein
MKHWMLAVALVCFCSTAKATPYLRLIGPDNYQVSQGALFSSKNINLTQESTVIGLVTHSTKDGSILPAWLQQYVAPEDWAIGTAVNYGGGNGSAAIGMVINVSPQLQQWGVTALNYLAPNSMSNVKSFLQTAFSQPDISVAIGPMLNLEAIQNGTVVPFNRWALDPVRYFAGASWKF